MIMGFRNSINLALSIKKLNRAKFFNELPEHRLLVIPNGNGKRVIHQDVYQDLRVNEGGRVAWKRD